MVSLQRKLGLCYYYLRRPQPALTHLRGYLARPDRVSAQDREDVERWIAEILGPGTLDMMVKKATVEWHSSATHGETLELVPVVSRWGTTSYDLTVTGHVGERAVFTATMVYINVIPGTKTPAPLPDHIKAWQQSSADRSFASQRAGMMQQSENNNQQNDNQQ